MEDKHITKLIDSIYISEILETIFNIEIHHAHLSIEDINYFLNFQNNVDRIMNDGTEELANIGDYISEFYEYFQNKSESYSIYNNIIEQDSLVLIPFNFTYSLN